MFYAPGFNSMYKLQVEVYYGSLPRDAIDKQQLCVICFPTLIPVRFSIIIFISGIKFSKKLLCTSNQWFNIKT